jgi:hypothetical protein
MSMLFHGKGYRLYHKRRCVENRRVLWLWSFKSGCFDSGLFFDARLFWIILRYTRALPTLLSPGLNDTGRTHLPLQALDVDSVFVYRTRPVLVVYDFVVGGSLYSHSYFIPRL